ncbi:MAG: TadE/TadG family type IV pilus assembly protein [Isosphaeraceae bacterium]
MRKDHRTPTVRRRGVTAVEVTLVMIPFMTLIVGTFEYCRYMMIRNLAENACREGARFAVVHTYDKTTNDVRSIVSERMGGLDRNIEGITTSISKVNLATGASLGDWTDARFGEGIAVTIQGNYRPITPNLLFMSTTIPIKCTSTMLSEAN